MASSAHDSGWIPEGIDEGLPSSARIYDYLLGGARNFSADRELGERFLQALPSARDVGRLNRAFLRRAVEFMVDSGIRQFLDIGSGIPSAGNVHEIAQSAAPEARVVYVDCDPVAVAHSELMLDGNPNAAMIQGDMRQPADILDARGVRDLIDFSEPVGLMLVGMIHFVPPELDAPALVARYRDELVPGSLMAISHFTADISPAEMAGVAEVMSQSADPIYPRSKQEVTELFAGFELFDPGVVGTALWRPEYPERAPYEPGASQIYAGVGRKQ